MKGDGISGSSVANGPKRSCDDGAPNKREVNGQSGKIDRDGDGQTAMDGGDQSGKIKQEANGG